MSGSYDTSSGQALITGEVSVEMSGEDSAGTPGDISDEVSPEASVAISGDIPVEMIAARPLLALESVTVSFDGFKALDQLSLRFFAGELRCVIGPNGAGKTTMMDVITGKTRPQAGRVYFAPERSSSPSGSPSGSPTSTGRGADPRTRSAGEPIDLTRLTEHQIVRCGIGRKFQRPTVFDQLTVFENLELACRGLRGVFRTLVARLQSEQRDAIEKTLALIQLSDHAHTPGALLAHGQKQWLEIGMLLVQQPRVLLLDEPVAGMTHQEVERTAELLCSLVPEHTVIVVEHDMDFVRKLASRVTVLHEGRVLAEGAMEAVQSDTRVIEVYLGSAAPAVPGCADSDQDAGAETDQDAEQAAPAPAPDEIRIA